MNKILESIDSVFESEESLEDKLRTIIDIYYEDKCNEDGDCFAGTEDSYAEEMLFQRVEELSTEDKPLPVDNIYSAITMADSEEQAVEKALEAANTNLKESEFDAADIADSWDDFMKWIEEDPNRCDAANHCSETGKIEDADFDSKEFCDLFRRFKEDQLDEDQQLSKLDLMAGEVITQLEQIKKADSSVKIDRPYIEQYMNTAYGSSSALDNKDVGYILGRVLKHYNLAEAEEFLPEDLRKQINAAMDRSIKQQDKEAEEDGEELEVSIPRIVKDVCKELNVSKEDKSKVSKYIRDSLRYYSEADEYAEGPHGTTGMYIDTEDPTSTWTNEDRNRCIDSIMDGIKNNSKLARSRMSAYNMIEDGVLPSEAEILDILNNQSNLSLKILCNDLCKVRKEDEATPIGGSSFNPGTRRKGDEEDRKKMVQRDAGEIDPERRAKAIERIKKYWPRVPKSWLNSRTDEYLEQTADHYEAMEARKLAAKQKQASAS